MKTLTNFHKLRDRLENDLSGIIVCELLAADARGFYIALASEVVGLECHELVGGFCHPSAGHWFRDSLGTRWRGSGPAMLLADGPNRSPASIIATAIHETAHVVLSKPMFTPANRDTTDTPKPPIDDARDTSESDATNRLTELVKTPPSEWPAHRESAWSGHDFNFVRVVAHVAHRLLTRGDYAIAPALLLNWKSHGYRSGWKAYFATLESELESREAEPLSEINRTMPPTAFLTLWTADVAESESVSPTSAVC